MIYFILFFYFIFVFLCLLSFFFFNDTATTEIYTLSLHDALPICVIILVIQRESCLCARLSARARQDSAGLRSEEHTSELQSRQYLVCRLLLEKKKKNDKSNLISKVK